MRHSVVMQGQGERTRSGGWRHSIVMRGLLDRKRSIFWWSLGLVLLTLMTVLLYPSIREQQAEFEKLLDAYPKAMLAFFGGDLFSPAGYISSQLFSLMVPAVLMALGISFGANAIAGEEERRTLDMLLSNPVSRRRVLLEKFVTLVLIMAVVSLIFWLALWLSGISVDLGLSGGRLGAATLTSAMIGLFFGSLALAVGAATGRRAMALGIASALGVAAFFLNGLADLADWLRDYRELSPFYFLVQDNPLKTGINWQFMAVMLGLVILMLGVSSFRFERRDLAV